MDDETTEDHTLGDYLLNNKMADYIYYEPLPNNHLELFQALAYPTMPWGYDRQQWSTFYFDTFVEEDIIGVVDSDSTFTSYLTNNNFIKNNKILIKGISPIAPYVNPYHKDNYIYLSGSHYENDNIALGFETNHNLMITNLMPMFFWKSTFKNFRDYISKLWNMTFDEAYKNFSKKPYCQFNILANYAIKFESDKYEFIDLQTDNENKLCVGQNGCPTSRDVICGLIHSFEINESEIENIIIKNSPVSAFGNVFNTLVDYNELKNDKRHANNFAHLCDKPCSKKQIETHYENVKIDLSELNENEKNKLEEKNNHFIKHDFNAIIIKG